MLEIVAEHSTVTLTASDLPLTCPGPARPISARRWYFRALVLQNPQYLCPISHELMEDQVTASDGHWYERRCIEEHFKKYSKTFVAKMSKEISKRPPPRNDRARSCIRATSYRLCHMPPDPWLWLKKCAPSGRPLGFVFISVKLGISVNFAQGVSRALLRQQETWAVFIRRLPMLDNFAQTKPPLATDSYDHALKTYS